jgi:hypothetical protein
LLDRDSIELGLDCCLVHRRIEQPDARAQIRDRDHLFFAGARGPARASAAAAAAAAVLAPAVPAEPPLAWPLEPPPLGAGVESGSLLHATSVQVRRPKVS